MLHGSSSGQKAEAFERILTSSPHIRYCSPPQALLMFPYLGRIDPMQAVSRFQSWKWYVAVLLTTGFLYFFATTAWAPRPAGAPVRKPDDATSKNVEADHAVLKEILARGPVQSSD